MQMSHFRHFRSERMRNKYLELMGGDQRLLAVLFEINRSDYDEQIVDFYLTMQLKGNRFFEFIVDKFQGSPAKTIAYALKRIEKRNTARPRILDLNWR